MYETSESPLCYRRKDHTRPQFGVINSHSVLQGSMEWMTVFVVYRCWLFHDALDFFFSRRTEKSTK